MHCHAMNEMSTRRYFGGGDVERRSARSDVTGSVLYSLNSEKLFSPPLRQTRRSTSSLSFFCCFERREGERGRERSRPYGSDRGVARSSVCREKLRKKNEEDSCSTTHGLFARFYILAPDFRDFISCVKKVKATATTEATTTSKPQSIFELHSKPYIATTTTMAGQSSQQQKQSAIQQRTQQDVVANNQEEAPVNQCTQELDPYYYIILTSL